MIATYKGEKQIGELVTRLYGEVRGEQAKRAEAALVKANPQLAELGGLKRGAPIVVPAVPGLRAAEKSEHAEPAPESVVAVRAALKAYRRQLGAALDAERAAIAATTDLVKSKEIRRLAKDAPEAAPYLEQTAAALKQRGADAELAMQFLKGLAKAEADLEILAKRLVDLG